VRSQPQLLRERLNVPRTSERKNELAKAYRRASLGLGAAALALDTAAFLLAGTDGGWKRPNWVIPIGSGGAECAVLVAVSEGQKLMLLIVRWHRLR
jgi:hypothetical protein